MFCFVSWRVVIVLLILYPKLRSLILWVPVGVSWFKKLLSIVDVDFHIVKKILLQKQQPSRVVQGRPDRLRLVCVI